MKVYLSAIRHHPCCALPLMSAAERFSAAGWQGRYPLASFRVGAATIAAAFGFPEHVDR